MSFSVLTRDEAAKIARISPRQLDRLIATAAGPAVTRIGRRVLLPTDSFCDWLRKGAPAPPAQRRYAAAAPDATAAFDTVSEALDEVRACQADIGERAAA